MAVSPHTKHVLYLKSGNRCAFLECPQVLVEEEKQDDRHSIVGVICHIKGQKPGSARYDPDMSDDERDAVENLLVLCPTHHKIIDDQPNEYTVEELLGIKKAHEAWVTKQVFANIAEVTFAELDVITKYLVAKCPQESDIRVMPPHEKIKRNALSSSVENLVRMGLARAKLVRDFIRRNPDPDFGERLRMGFVDEYNRMVKEGLQGDLLFDSLMAFASNESTDFKQQAAGLTVLTYFFETCDVFER